jgi:hypothetical protein
MSAGGDGQDRLGKPHVSALYDSLTHKRGLDAHRIAPIAPIALLTFPVVSTGMLAPGSDLQTIER